MKKRYTWIVMMILMSFPTYAAYYVDSSGSCSDSPTYGSEAQPWCTITYGVSQIGAGDELYVKSGTYNEVFNIDDLSASQADPTVVSAYPGHDVTILGDGFNSGRVRIRNCDWLEFRGFEITNTNHGLLVFMQSSNILVEDITIYSIGQEGIQVYDNSHDVQLINNTIYDTGHHNPSWGEGIYIGSGSGTAYDYTNNILVKGNTIYGATAESIELKPRTYAVTVEDNIIYQSTTGSTAGSGAALEIGYSCFSSDCAPQEPNHIIRNNIVHDVTGDCINIDTSATVYNNVVYACSDNDIIVNDNDNYQRKLYHNTADSITVSGSPDLDMQNNIGTSSGNNLASNSAYFVSSSDYHLVSGSAPIDAGADLRSIVAVDIEGRTRDNSPDIGAYEFSGTSEPSTIPSERLAPEGWHDIAWNDPGDWTTIDVTTQGINPGSDVTTQVKNLIDAQNNPTIIYFPEGRYIINDLQLDSDNDNIIIRGAGPEKTIFEVTTGTNAIYLRGTGAGPQVPLTDTVAPGSKVISVSDSTSFSVGDIVSVWEDLPDYYRYQSWGSWARGGVFKITAINDNQITLDNPLAIGMDDLNTAVIRNNAQIETVSIEDLRIDHTSSAMGETIPMRWCNNIRIKNIVSNIATQSHVGIKECRNVIVRDSFLDSAQSMEGGEGYGVTSQALATNVLITNNLMRNLHVSFGIQAGASYNIYSYNMYVDDIKEICNSDAPDPNCNNRNWIMYKSINGITDSHEGGNFAIHGHYPHTTLYEGNINYQFGIDHYWGLNGPTHVFFRNRILGHPDFHPAFWTGGSGVHIDGPSDGQSIIGNIFENGAWIEIGTWSFDPARPPEDLFIAANDVVGMRNFSNSGGWVRTEIYQRDDMPDVQLPDSLYLESAPDFWPNDLAWPPYGPDVASDNKIPAQLRYEAMQGCVPITNAGLLQIINNWKKGTGSMSNLMQKIKEWKVGCE